MVMIGCTGLFLGLSIAVVAATSRRERIVGAVLAVLGVVCLLKPWKWSTTHAATSGRDEAIAEWCWKEEPGWLYLVVRSHTPDPLSDQATQREFRLAILQYRTMLPGCTKYWLSCLRALNTTFNGPTYEADIRALHEALFLNQPCL